MLHYLKSFVHRDKNKEHQPSTIIAGTIDKGHDDEDFEKVEEDTQVPVLENTEEEKEAPAPPPETNYHFIDYKVTPDDTLYGIALTYLINPAVIKRDNGFELDEVFPGMVIKLRVREEQAQASPVKETGEKRSAEAEDIRKNLPHFDNLPVKPRSSTVDLKWGYHTMPHITEWEMYYCTSIGDIEGVVTIDQTKFIFTPVGLTKSKLKSKTEAHEEAESPESGKEAKAVFKEDYQNKYLSHFDAEIELQDIAECNIMVVPSSTCEDNFDVNQEFEKDYLVQIILSNHGHRSMGKYLNDLLSHMKGKKTSYACVYFKLKNERNEEQLYSNNEKDKMTHQLQRRINSSKAALQENQPEESSTSEGTHLPYFEFLFDKFEKEDATLLRKLTSKENAPLPPLTEEERRKILAGIYDEETKQEEVIEKIAKQTRKRMMIPKFVGESQILNLEQWTELINTVPPLYQTLQWRLIHSTLAHGSSYRDLIRKTQCSSPSIIIIKDENDFVFGVYCSDEIRFSQDYYGIGETFLFTFRDLNEISTFHWTRKNNLFIMAGEQGITFGAGGYFGLWINNELTKGRSFESETFDNKMLSYKSDFDIMKLEVWSIIDPFSTPKEDLINYSDMSELKEVDESDTL